MRRLIVSLAGALLSTMVVTGCGNTDEKSKMSWVDIPPEQRTEAQKKEARAAQERTDKLERQVMKKYFGK